MRLFSLSLFIALFFSGCFSQPKPESAYMYDSSKDLLTYTYDPSLEQPHDSHYDSWIQEALFDEYKKWYKTPYRYGGRTQYGIDCSALVQNIYDEAFGIHIPRTTRGQIKYGYRVSRNKMREGDIIFFKTGYDSRHAGIIIQKDKFLHASQKHGVIISSVYNPYWRTKFLQLRRVLP